MASRLNDPSVLPRSVTGADIPPDAISVHDVLMQLVDDLAAALGSAAVIELQLDAPFSHVLIARDNFAHAILQLAGLTGDAAPSGGRFVIRTSVAPWGDRCSHCGIGDLVVVVSNTRVRSTPEIPADVSRILNGAGGSISVSSAPGHGASFRIRLPLV